jgi:hypothetical protein
MLEFTAYLELRVSITLWVSHGLNMSPEHEIKDQGHLQPMQVDNLSSESP